MLKRNRLTKAINSALQRSPITAILGPRQCGKTTISREIAAQSSPTTIFDLEDPVNYHQLFSAPKITLESLKGLIIIDEIQRMPELFPILRLLVDRPESQSRFLILGSASPGLIKNTSETLSGRISFVDMSGFVLDELPDSNYKDLWIRGGFPRSYLAPNNTNSYAWRNDFIRTFLERDIPQLGINLPSAAIRRFWTMLAHYHGQVWNGSELARSLGVSEPTTRRYLDILSGAYVVRQIQPWFENLKKRQVKSPKIYVKDSGILHTLLSLDNELILAHPKLGSSWEGFVIEQIITITGYRDFYFWATYSGAELDLLLFHNNKRIGFEIKYTDAPKTTRSMHVAINDLALHKLIIVFPGDTSYRLSPKITVVGIQDLRKLLVNL